MAARVRFKAHGGEASSCVAYMGKWQ